MVAGSGSCLSPASPLSSWGSFFHKSGVKRLSAWDRRGQFFEMPELCLVKTGKHPSSWLDGGDIPHHSPSPLPFFPPILVFSSLHPYMPVVASVEQIPMCCFLLVAVRFQMTTDSLNSLILLDWKDNQQQ